MGRMLLIIQFLTGLINKTNPVKSVKNPGMISKIPLIVDDTAEIINTLKNKFPEIKGPIKEDICYATTNRQSAVKEIASKCDLFFVVGSRNSSNSVRLVLSLIHI